LYSQQVPEHFRQPRNVGEVGNPDGVGQIGDPECGDFLRITLRVEEGRIAEVKFLCHGCPAAIACASATTELARGRHVDDAWNVTDDTVLEALGGLPEQKIHCSLLGPAALHAAIMNYVVRSVEADREAASASPSPAGI